MKYIKQLFITVLLSIIFLISCNKDNENEKSTPPLGVVVTTVVGTVVNSDNEPIYGVEVEIDGEIFTTENDGSFMFKNVALSNDRYRIDFTKDDYFKTFRSGKAATNKITNVNVTMIEHADITVHTAGFNSNFDGVLYNVNGIDTLVYFPSSLNFVKKEGGNYFGNVNVFVKYLNSTLPEYSKITPGGDQFGRYNNQDVYLNSYGGFLVELYSDNGEELNLSLNNTEMAEIHIPIPAIIDALAPDSIDLWNSGDDLAYSNNEGSGRKRGGNYVGSVAHFTTWNMQQKTTQFGTVKGRVIDMNNDPVDGVRVLVGQTYAITNYDGVYEQIVPANVDGIIVQIDPDDYFGNPSTPNPLPALGANEIRNNIDFILPTMGVITGRLVNCSGVPIAGQVVIHNGSSVASTYTSDGNFTLHYDATVTAFDITARGNNYDIIEPISGISYPYNTGDIEICPPPPPPPAGTNKISVEDSLGVVTDYTNFNSAVGHLYPDEDRLWVDVNGGSDSFTFSIENFNGIGSYIVMDASVYLSEFYFENLSGQVNITEYSTVGGRIKGAFTFTGNGGENVTGMFNVHREADSY